MWRQSPAAVCSPVRNKGSILFPLLGSSLSLLQHPPSTSHCPHPVPLLSDRSTEYTFLVLLNALSRPLISSVTASYYPVHSARLPRWIGPQVYCTTPAQLRFFYIRIDFVHSGIRNTTPTGRWDYSLCFSQRHGDSI